MEKSSSQSNTNTSSSGKRDKLMDLKVDLEGPYGLPLSRDDLIEEGSTLEYQEDGFPVGCLCKECGLCSDNAGPLFWKCEEFSPHHIVLTIRMAPNEFKRYINSHTRVYVYEDPKGFYVLVDNATIILWTPKEEIVTTPEKNHFSL